MTGAIIAALLVTAIMGLTYTVLSMCREERK